MDFSRVASDENIEKAAAALKTNNIDVRVVENGEAAKKLALELIPAGAEVMTNSSVTVDTIGLGKELVESGRYDPVRKKFAAMDPKTQGKEMRKLGCVPDWSVGSVHAITLDGHILIASASGSQLPGYIFGAANVLWIAGAQKIVKDVAEGMRRIEEYTLPLEDARARKAYGNGSNIRKLLIINNEPKPGRSTLILIKEKIGF